MTSPKTLSASDLRAVVATYAKLLRSHKEVINRLNVYPVPDGDTGTNMTLTVESVVEALEGLGSTATLSEVGQAIAHGSLMGARGNSGVILSQLLRGLVEGWRAEGGVEPDQLATSMAHADDLARHAVVRPVEGTILSVARAAAEGAREGVSHLTTLVRRARDRAREALARTPEQLPVLKQAGVVDSGGTGLVLLIDALCHVVAGDPLPIAPNADSIIVHVAPEAPGERNIADLRYEVMYLLEADDDDAQARSARCGRASATPSSSSAATASTTATSTPTTSARRSRRRWTRGVRATSRSPTSPSRSSRSAGCARPA